MRNVVRIWRLFVWDVTVVWRQLDGLSNKIIFLSGCSRLSGDNFMGENKIIFLSEYSRLSGDNFIGLSNKTIFLSGWSVFLETPCLL